MFWNGWLVMVAQTEPSRSRPDATLISHLSLQPAMNRFDDYPYGPVLSALNTLLGRAFLVIAASGVGFMLGIVTAFRSFKPVWLALDEMILLGIFSIFYGIGLWVFPLIFLFALGFVLREWRLRYALLCTVLMWVNMHRTIRWTEFDGPMAQPKKVIQEVLPVTSPQETAHK